MQRDDFDKDSDVDGGDLHAWQRGESRNRVSATDLSDGRQYFGAGPLTPTTAVPEPTAIATALLNLTLN